MSNHRQYHRSIAIGSTILHIGGITNYWEGERHGFRLIEKWEKVEGEDNFIITNTTIELDSYRDPVLFAVSSDFCT